MTEAQVKEIAILIAKELYHKDREPMGATYDHKSGNWNCLIPGPGFGGSLFIDIRDKDAYYKVMEEGKTKMPGDFKMSTILKRRIAKITERKG